MNIIHFSSLTLRVVATYTIALVTLLYFPYVTYGSPVSHFIAPGPCKVGAYMVVDYCHLVFTTHKCELWEENRAMTSSLKHRHASLVACYYQLQLYPHFITRSWLLQICSLSFA